jgi:hypothetical protein
MRRVTCVESLRASSAGVITTGTIVRPVRAFSTVLAVPQVLPHLDDRQPPRRRYMRILSE